MRLLFIIDSLALAGAQKHACHLALGLKQRGHQVEVVYLNEIAHTLYLTQLRTAGIPTEAVGVLRVLTGWVFWRIWKKFLNDRNRPQIVAFLFVSILVGRLAGAIVRWPIVTCLQARNVDYRRWQRSLIRVTAAD